MDETSEDFGPGPDEAVVDEMLATARPRLRRALKRIERPRARVAVIDTAIGRLLIADGPRGLIAVKYLDTSDGAGALEDLRQRFDLEEDPATAARIADEIERFLKGDADAVARRRVDLSLVESEFQRRALKRLRTVPPGSVVTYAALADAIGAPSSQRAIGNTMASNPLPIYVPCHRVIKSDGTIGNYGGGIARKLKLLGAEGFRADRGNRLPGTAVYGHWASRIFCRPACTSVRRASRKRWLIFGDSAHARGAGLRACKICHPA
ncbi:MAG TPA: methylated-DNA--[protein]-cysteine S-methyltransferase [Candidatus Binataceae bacterium]|nr:methylated-DNA--[protein]-cysteine S-methyltransferase [Candidatus Binataceae bacterium]